MILVLVLISTIDTKQFGLFTQARVGQNSKMFTIFKIRTMLGQPKTNVTTSNTINITKFGKWLRQHKLDELPQIYNVLLGQMSFVGPRPDVCGFADQLQGENKKILDLKPGIFGLAQLAFSQEEELLGKQPNSEKYNQEVIWPEKVRINLEYAKNRTFFGDCKIILQSLKKVFF